MKNYTITIYTWMISKLKLKGDELLCYAFIFNYSQMEQTGYIGSLIYMCEVLNIDRLKLKTILQKLKNKNLIKQEIIFINGSKTITFKINFDILQERGL